jgi:hypothetical protein
VKESKLYAYVNEIINKVDDENLLFEWEEEMKGSGHVTAGIIDLFLLKYKCKYNRDTLMKNSLVWKRNILRAARTIIQVLAG